MKITILNSMKCPKLFNFSLIILIFLLINCLTEIQAGCSKTLTELGINTSKQISKMNPEKFLKHNWTIIRWVHQILLLENYPHQN